MSQSLVIDIGDRDTRVGLVATSKNKLDLVSVAVGKTVPQFFSSDNPQLSEKQSQVIVDLVHLLKTKEEIAHIVIPDAYVFSQIVDMPKLKEKELLSAIRYQADEFIPMPIDESSIDIEILEDNQKTKKLKILIIASAKKIVDRVAQCIELAGLEPDSLENELNASARLVGLYPPRNDGLFVLINVGYTASSIYVFDGTTKLILLSRTIKIGIELLLRSITLNLNIDTSKAAELLRTIGFGTGGSVDVPTIILPIIKEFIQEFEKVVILTKDKYTLPIKQVYTCNHDSEVAFLPEQIAALTAIPTSQFPLSNVLNQNRITQQYGKSITQFLSLVSGVLR